MAKQSLDEWLDHHGETLTAVAIRAGLAKGDRSPEYVALFAIEEAPWLGNRDHAPEMVSRAELHDEITEAIRANGGDQPGTMIRIVPFDADGKKLRSWTHTTPTQTNSWQSLPRGEGADQMTARGLAEAVSGVCRSQVAFVDRLTDVVAVLGHTIADSQTAQNDISAKLLDHQQAWIDAMAQDVEEAARDLAESEEAVGVDPLRETVADLVRQFVGMGMGQGFEMPPEEPETPDA